MRIGRVASALRRRLPTNFALPGQRVPLHFIESIDIEPIAACNLGCGFCQVPGWSRAKATRAMGLELFREIVAKFPNLRHVKVQGMGEPFINPRLPDMIAHLSGRGIRSSLVNNGTLLDEAAARRIVAARLTNITFSVDGATKATYEAARPGAVFEEVTSNIRRFSEINAGSGHRPTNTQIDCLVSNGTILGELPEVVRLAGALGVQSVHVKTRIKEWIKKERDLDFGLKAHQVIDLADDVAAVMAGARRVARELGVRFSFNEDGLYDADNPCQWPFSSLYVSVEGKIVPCCVVGVPETWCLGDLTRQSLAEIWNGLEYRRLRSDLASRRLPSHCESCYRDCGSR